MIANRWDASLWSAHSVQQFGLLKLDDSETARSGFFFRFDHVDESPRRFIYDAYGTFTDNTSYENPACIGSGSGSASHSPWPSPSSLAISYDLTQVSGPLQSVATAKQPGSIPTEPGSTLGGAIRTLCPSECALRGAIPRSEGTPNCVPAVTPPPLRRSPLGPTHRSAPRRRPVT